MSGLLEMKGITCLELCGINTSRHAVSRELHQYAHVAACFVQRRVAWLQFVVILSYDFELSDYMGGREVQRLHFTQKRNPE